MKYAILFVALAGPVAAQDFAVRPSDNVPDRTRLADMILDRDLEYFDGGVSRYSADGGYT